MSVRSWWAIGALAFALLGAVGAPAEQPIKPWSAKATPPLVLHDLDGHVVNLASLRGRVVVVNFWATWCEPCIAEMPSLERLSAKMAGRPFAVLAVNYGETPPKIQSFLKKSGIGLHVLLDPDQEVAEKWGAKGLPMTFLVDAKGKIRYWVFGERDWSQGESLQVVEKLLAEAPSA